VNTIQKFDSAPTLRRFKPYPAYKDTGIDWLGAIPAHWEVRRLKTIASIQLSNVDKKSVEGQVSVRLCNYVDVYYNERITADLDFMTATATPEQVRRFSLRIGDVLVTKDSESWTDIAVPAVVASELRDVLCGYHLALVRPTCNCDGAFLARAFSAIGPRDQFQISANGITRFGLGADAIRTGLFAIPPAKEQRGIVAFLDRETAKIDALVAKKEQLIDLLHEERNALITGAVTNGLDPSVPMKNSGVEWLGEIPAHWGVKKLKRISKRVDVGIAEAATHAYADEGIPIIRTTNVRANRVLTDDLLRIEPWFAEKNRSKYLFVGDLVTVRTGAPGTTAVIPAALDHSQCFTMLITTLRKGHVSAFVSYFLNSTAARVYFDLEGWEALKQTLAFRYSKRFRFLFLPKTSRSRLWLI
jgi:type I restriction enzyme, S subunit